MSDERLTRFFGTLFENILDEYVQVTVLRHPRYKPQSIMFFDGVDELVSFVLRYADDEHLHVMFSVVTRREKGAKAAHAKRAHFVWADVDVTQDVAKLDRRFIFPPTFVVASGGGLHAYWKLSRPVERQHLDQFLSFLNTEFRPLVRGDHVYDAARVMRVPYTINPKHGIRAEILVEEPAAAYDPDDFMAAVRASRGLSRKLRRAIFLGDASPWEDDRSDRDFAICTHLVKHGLSDKGIEQVFRLRPCGNKQHPNYFGHYLPLTIKNARLQVESHSEARSLAFTARPDGTYYGTKRVATWTVEPLAVVRDIEPGVDGYLVNVHVRDKQYPRVIIPVTAFSSPDNLARAVRIAGCQWLGTRSDLAHFHEHIFLSINGNTPLVALRHVGFVDGYFISANQAVHRDHGVIPVDDTPFVLVSKSNDLIETQWVDLPDRFFQENLKKFFDLILTVNRQEVMLPVLGWMFACPVKSYLFDRLLVGFPTLNIWGERGSGKTSLTEEVVQRFFGFVQCANLSSATTDFVVLKRLGASNAFPVVFEEYRASNAHAERGRLFHYVRMAYDQGYDARGRPDQSITVYPLIAPTVIVGEHPLIDSALLERVVQVELRPDTIRRGTPAWEAFYALRDFPLHGVIARYLQFVLHHLQDTYEHFSKAKGIVVKNWPLIPERIANNMAIVGVGLFMLRDFALEFGVDLGIEDDTVVQAVKHPITQVVGVGRAATPDIVDVFVTEVLEAVNAYEVDPSPKLQPPFVYVVRREDEHGVVLYLRRNSALSWFQDVWARRTGERLDPRSVFSILQRKPYYMQGRSVYNPRPANSPRGRTMYFDTAIVLKSAQEYGLDVPENMLEWD